MRAIDLFAGAGGFSTGATQAGATVVWAANHWPDAVAVHAANHATTEHWCQDLHQADWSRVPAHDVLLASPACQGHSRARGKDRPHHDAARSTAWAVVSAAEAHRPPFVVVENVPEFQSWALFPAWRQAMRALGYRMTWQVLDAADFGVPQHRARLFVIGSLGSPVYVRNPRVEHVPASSLIDWDATGWAPVAKPGRSVATLDRVRAAQSRYGKRCLIAYYGSDRGRSLDAPLGTVTTRDRHAVVDGDRMRMLSVAESRRAMGFPDGYRLTGRHRLDMHLLGNAVCPPVAREVVRQVMESA